MFFNIRKKIAEMQAKNRKEAEKIEKIRYGKEGKPKWTTMKKYMAYILFNCELVKYFSMIMIWRTQDSSALATLVAAFCTEAVALIAYAIKSTAENTVNGITYMQAQHDLGESTNDDEAVG